MPNRSRDRQDCSLRWVILLGFIGCFGNGPWLWAETRTPQVAGQFYPAEHNQLFEVIHGFLQEQPSPQIAEKPRVLILPHAGYLYSGSVAASGIRHLLGYTYDGVVVVGFTHRLVFSGSSVDQAEVYETPLGQIPTDQAALSFLSNAHPSIHYRKEAHITGEHSLEVMLPWLQVALGEFKLVPLLMGSSSLEDASALADALSKLGQRGDYLFIFSTDLSHYHPEPTARLLDQQTIEALLFETPQAVDRLFASGALEACGRGPILTGLLLSAHLGYLKHHLVRYATSGEVTEDKSSVVGYAAIVMVERPAHFADWLSRDAGMALVRSARQTLEAHFRQSRSDWEPRAHEESLGGWVRLNQYPELARAQGMFVTLKRQGRLRGCIGRIETDQSMADLLPIVALDAALRDPRFKPVTSDELDQLQVELSILGPPAELKEFTELVAGRDGVVLEYQGHRGLFLPQVWEETGWTRVEFLQELARQKLGLAPEIWKQAKLFVFQDQIFKEPDAEFSESSSEEVLSDSPKAH